MIYNAINYNRPFGIVLKDSNNIYKIGCKAKVSKVLKIFPDGKYDIIVKGINRFEISNTFLDDQTIIGKVKIQLINSELNILYSYPNYVLLFL